MLAHYLCTHRIRRFSLFTLAFLLTGVVFAQTTVTTRLANGTYDCNTEEYCLDVEFQADMPGEELYGMNVRFFYDDDVLEFVDFRNFVGGYAPFFPDPPEILTGAAGSGATLFDFPPASVAEFVNGAIILDDPNQTPVILPTASWERIFTICFDAQTVVDFNSFCPSVVWDLEEDPAGGGFLMGDDGVVITLVDGATSVAAIENVEQYNWNYDGIPGVPYGSPNPVVCTDLNNISIAASATDPTQCSGLGEINLTLTGVADGDHDVLYDGGSFLNVSVTGGAATINAPAGNYNNLEISVNSCTSVEYPSVTLTDPADPVIAGVTGNNPTTCPGNEGTIQICGLTSGEEYDIDFDQDGNPAATQTATADVAGCVELTGLTAGVYTNFVVTSTLTLCDSDPDLTIITLIDPAGPTLDPITTIDPTSCGGSNGNIRICGLTFLSDYDVTFDFDLTPQGPINLIGDLLGCITIPGLSAGSYTNFSVINTANGCVSTDAGPHVLTDPSGPTISSITPNSPITCGGSTGSLEICGLSATLAYTVNYKKDGLDQTHQIAIADLSGCISVIGLSAAEYTEIQVGDNLTGCSTLDPGIYTITDPSGPMITTVTTNDPLTCLGVGGSIEICGLTTGASYSVSYEKDMVPQVPQIWVGDLSGCITILGLGAGSYTDFNITNILTTCSSTEAGPHVLNDPTPEAIGPVSSTDPITCGGITGSIELCGLTPAVTYTVNFDKDAAGQLPQVLVADLGGCVTLLALGEGSYTDFEVTNAVTSCISSFAGPVDLTDPSGPVLGAITTTDPTTCLGLGGFITICGLQTGVTYSVSFDKDGLPLLPQVAIADLSGCINLLGLGAGSYDNIVVQNVITSCSTADVGGPYVLEDPDPATIGSILTTNPSTCGGSDGSISICGLGIGLSFDVDFEVDGLAQSEVGLVVALDGCLLIENLPVGIYANIVITDLLTGCITPDPGTYELVDNCTYAINDINNTFLEVPVSGNVLTNDFDPENDVITINTTPTCDPTNGSVVLNPDGSYTYTPDPDFVGEDSFCYEICDDNAEPTCDEATVVITVIQIESPINNPPVANNDAYVTEAGVTIDGDLLANDFDPDGDNLIPVIIPTSLPSHGIVVINLDGTFDYQPFPGYTGDDEFTYQVCDDGLPPLCDVATVTIEVLPDEGNSTVAVDDAYLGRENEIVLGDISENDWDPESDNQTFSSTPLQDVANGTLVLNTDGSFTYTPDADYIGPDQFIYQVCDDGSPSACDTATAYLSVRRVCAEFELYVNLEGSMVTPDGTPTYGSDMRTALNDLRILPGQTSTDLFLGDHYTPPGQPYNDIPWAYTGTEGSGYDSGGVPGDAGYPADVVDWVLVSIRDDNLLGSQVCQFAALLHFDGTLEPIDDCCEINGGDYYVVIEHRNHLIVQSHIAVDMDNGLISYDFRAQDSYTDPILGFGSVGQKEITTGVWAMYAANGDQVSSTQADTDLNLEDILYWESENGTISRYRKGDYDMNGDVNLNDRRLWELNNSEFSSVDR